MARQRRKFLKNSLLITGGVLLMPNLISCGSDDTAQEVDMDPGTPLNRDNFFEGVASFDPSATAVLLWTRYTPQTNAEVALVWQIATDRDFSTVVRSGEVNTGGERDFTVTIEVRDLTPNSAWFYRFINREEETVSATGETITLPEGSDTASEILVAACSCSNYIAGYFNVYEAIADSEADVVLHLGDYIYEYGTPGSVEAGLGRNHEPDRELLGLEGYRTRYKQYRSDDQLQELHRRKPFFTVWDDHEIADNSWVNGAAAHQQDEGDYEVRKQEAIRAYSEYLPVRTPNQGRVYRRVELGGLAALLLLDTRHAGRDEQLRFSTFLDADNTLDAEGLNTARNEASRTILGNEQRTWLQGELANTAGKWCILGQQVLMGRMLFPAELLPLVEKAFSEQASSGSVSTETRAELEARVQELLALKIRQRNNDETLTPEELARITVVVPYNLDAWDGYAAEREWLFSQVNAPVVVVSGDSHNAWYNELYREDRSLAGYEVATAAVSSAGFERILPDSASARSQFELALGILVDDLVYTNAYDKGFILMRCSAASMEVSWNFVDTITSPSFSVTTGRTEILSR